MILRDEKDFTVECETDTSETRVFADTLANVMSRYDLDGRQYDEDLTFIFDGIPLLVRHKRLH